MGSLIGPGTDIIPDSVWFSPVNGSEQTSQDTVLFWFKTFSPYLEALGSPAFAGRDFASRAT